MKKILIYSTIAILLSGCGGSEGGNSADDTPGENPGKGDTSMVINKAYVAAPGDQIIKDSILARIKVTHKEGNSRSTVELVEGKAILRKK